MDSNTFDKTKFYLGKLCNSNHEWNQTGQTLRRIKNKGCPICHYKCLLKCKEKNPEVYKAIAQRHRAKPETLKKRREYQAEYVKTHPEYRKILRANNKRYNQTEKGRRVKKGTIDRYRLTEKGKAAMRACKRRRRAAKLNAHSIPISEAQRVERLNSMGGNCAYCNNPATTLDHFLPISKGGSDVLSNLLPACNPCNCAKNNFDPVTWYKSQPFYSKKRWKKILSVLGKTEGTIGQLPLF